MLLLAVILSPLVVGMRPSQVQETAELKQCREGGRGREGWWRNKEMLIPTKGNQSPNDPTGRKGEREGNEMENSNKLEIRHGVEGGNMEAVKEGDSSLKGQAFWRGPET